MPIAELRSLLRSRREERGLSRSAVADLACQLSEREFSERTIQALEVDYQRLPPPDILRPVADALELDWEEVLRVAGY